MINGKNFFDQAVKNNLRTYDNIRKIATGKDDDYITGYLLDYPYFKEYYKLIAIDLYKQQKLENNTIFFSSLKRRKKQLYIFQNEQLKYYDFISF